MVLGKSESFSQNRVVIIDQVRRAENQDRDTVITLFRRRESF